MVVRQVASSGDWEGSWCGAGVCAQVTEELVEMITARDSLETLNHHQQIITEKM